MGRAEGWARLHCGVTRRRRHAHTDCVLAARKRGQLVLKDEWQRAQPRAPSLWRRLLGRA
jgi:hypothetical protein